MGKIFLGDESGGDSQALIHSTKRGRCELVFISNDGRCTFPCSLSALINVGLGARTHLASDYGACSLTKTPGGVKIALTPWGRDLIQFLVPMDVYAEALDDVTQVVSVKDKISLQ